MTFGRKLLTSRESRGLSQKELANCLGVTVGVIAEWEADEATPNIAELSSLSNALNISADILLDATMTDVAVTGTIAKQESIPATSYTKIRKKKIWILGAIALGVILVAVAMVIWLQGVFGQNSLMFAEDMTKIECADASVVTIFCYDYEGELAATGSGFIAFDSSTIITNYHVMASAYTCKISTNQDISYKVSKILCYSEEQDIAVLRLAEDTQLQPLTLGDSSIIKKGETVVAIGSPLGIKNTVSTGVLSGRLMENNMDVLQFTAPISSGSSGGALFDNSGKVIGVTFASIVDGQNINLAIPIELVISLYGARKAEKDVSAIHIEKYPYVKYLELYDYALQVSIDLLKAYPEQYDDKLIILRGVVITSNSLYVVDKDYYSDNMPINDDGYFEDHPYLYIGGQGDCQYVPSELAQGQEVVVVGRFRYEATGKRYYWVNNGKIVSQATPESYASMSSILIYYP